MIQSDNVLLEVVNKGSFSGAAKTLFLTPQAIMKQVKQIEQQAGFPIFIRTPRGVSLTPQGERYISCIRRQQNERQAVLAACREGTDECLRLGLCSGITYYHLSKVLVIFRQTHPKTMIRFILSHPEKLFENLLRGAFDAYIAFRQPQESTEIDFFPIMEYSAYCIVEQTHPLADKTVIEYEDLFGYSVCVGAVNKYAQIIANLESHGIHPSLSTLPPLFLCYDSTVFVSLMEVDTLPCGLVQIPFNSKIKNAAGVVCKKPVSQALIDLIEITRELV